MNTTAQVAFLEALGRRNPRAVIERVETNAFAGSLGVLKEYVNALSRTRQLHRVTTDKLAIALSEVPSAAAPASAAAAPLPSSFGGLRSSSAAPKFDNSAAFAQAPLKVEVTSGPEGATSSQLWRTLRAFGVAGLVVYGLSYLMEEVNPARGLGMNKEIRPEEANDKTFEDVKGAAEAKGELLEIVEYLRDPGRFTRLGGKLPKGVLLMGPPGTGKTLLAKAIAGEAGVPFFYASGSEFEEMFVGVGARRIRDLFEAAKLHTPCIVFIDEIDAVGSKRGSKDTQSVKMTLNQLLVELDGFRENQGVIVVAATNFPELLDPALVRPGRFDRKVAVPLPDVKGRREILDLYASRIPADGVDIDAIARGTPGASGADLANLVNVAALRASVAGKDSVTTDDFEFAKDKIQMGNERKSAIIPLEVRKMTAYHEGGHALVALHTDGAMDLHKATIMPRGSALGMVHQLPSERDSYQRTRKQMLASLDVCMGGRVAEELVFGADEVTSGASSDIQKATQIAEQMVTRFGMDASGQVGIVHLPRDGKQSDETLKAIDDEIRRLLNESYSRAKRVLTSHRTELERLAAALLKHETLSRDDIRRVLRGEQLNK